MPWTVSGLKSVSAVIPFNVIIVNSRSIPLALFHSQSKYMISKNHPKFLKLHVNFKQWPPSFIKCTNYKSLIHSTGPHTYPLQVSHISFLLVNIYIHKLYKKRQSMPSREKRKEKIQSKATATGRNYMSPLFNKDPLHKQPQRSYTYQGSQFASFHFMPDLTSQS